MKLIQIPFTETFINPEKIVGVRPHRSNDPASDIITELTYESGAVTNGVYFKQTVKEIVDSINHQLEQ